MIRWLAAVALVGWIVAASPAFAIGTINIANAPEWQQSHAYILGDRVVAGPGLSGLPNTYTNGAALYLWAVSTPGTSSGSGLGPQTCGSPAGVGGIPTGSWGGATTVMDGSVVWTCLTPIDYVSITGFNCDSAAVWATSTSYKFIAEVINGGRCYAMNTTFSGEQSCTSASSGSGPVGTVFNVGENDNNCVFVNQGDLTYSSQANRFPQQVSSCSGGVCSYTIQYSQNVNVQLWWGGNQRPRYQAGQGHEAAALQIHYHMDKINDAAVFCPDGVTDSGSCLSSSTAPVTYLVTISPPPGDRLRDNVTPQTGPLRYDETKGVAIFNNTTPVTNSGVSVGLNLGDSFVKLAYLQIQSTQDSALMTTPGNSGWTFGPTNTNAVWLQDDLIIGGTSAAAAVSGDAEWNIDNSPIISTSTVTGSSPLHLKFEAIVHDSTFICSGNATSDTAVEQYTRIANTLPMNNNLMLGCHNPYAVGSSFATSGANNATDVAGTPSGTFTDPIFGQTFTAEAFPGTTLTGLTPSAQLVNPTVGASFDGRVKNASADIYNAAAAFSYAGWGMLNPVVPGSDIMGTARPVSGRYDIGAEMFLPVGNGSGKRWFLH